VKKLVLLLVSSVAVLNATSGFTCKIYEVKPALNDDGNIEVTFEWYRCQDKLLGRYIDLNDQLASRDSLVKYVIKEAALFRDKVAKGHKFVAMEVEEKDRKLTKIVFRLHQPFGWRPKSAYLADLQAHYTQLLNTLDSGSPEERNKALKENFRPGTDLVWARQITSIYLITTERALEINNYIARHGIECFYGDRSKCHAPDLHKGEK